MQEETFEGAKGLALAARSWQPDGAPRAVVVINCQGPAAPTLEMAVGFSSDSIAARYFNSTGK